MKKYTVCDFSNFILEFIQLWVQCQRFSYYETPHVYICYKFSRNRSRSVWRHKRHFLKSVSNIVEFAGELWFSADASDVCVKL